MTAEAGAGGPRLWDVKTGSIVADYYAPPGAGEIVGIATEPEGDLFVGASDTGRLIEWSSEFADAPGRVLDGLQGSIDSLTFASAPSKRLIVAPTDQPLVCWNLGNAGRRDGSSFNGGIVESPKARGVSASVAFDPKDDTLASAEGDKVYLWSPDDGWAHGGPLQAHGVVHQVAWSPDGRYLAAAADDFASVVWDMAHDRKLALSDGFESPRASGTCGLATAFSPDGRLLAMGTSSGVRIWDTSSWQRRTKSVDADLIVGANVTSVSFSPDGRLLVSTAATDVVQVWALPAGKEVQRLEAARFTATCSAFSPDGKLLAVGDAGGYVSLWTVGSWKLQKALPYGHTVKGVAFSPDGTQLVAGGDGPPVMWDVQSSRELGRLKSCDSGSPCEAQPFTNRQERSSGSVAFSRTGEKLAWAVNDPGSGRLAVVADAAVDSWIQTARRLSGRGLSSAERAYYLGSPSQR